MFFWWRINLWSLPEIFPKLCRLFHQVHQDQKIWGWNWFFKFWIFQKGDGNWAFNMLIGEDNNTYICKYFRHWSLISKVQFFDILNFTCIFRNFPLAIISDISCEFQFRSLVQALCNLFEVLTPRGCWEIIVNRGYFIFWNFRQGLGWGLHGPDGYWRICRAISTLIKKAYLWKGKILLK